VKRCVSCGSTLEGTWDCPGCGFQPQSDNGLLCFAPDAAGGGNGFDPASFEHLAAIEEESFWFRARSRLILWALERYFPSTASMLEIGCGTGYVLAGIANAHPGIRLAGADLYPEGLRFARERVPAADLYQLDATNIPFKDEWDVVGAFDVLEHVPDDEAFLAGAWTAVRPGGGLLVTVPQHPSLWSAADDYAHHVRRYRRGELVEKVERAGFRVERVTSFVSLLLPALWLSRLRDRNRGEDFDPVREHTSTRGLGALESALNLERRGIERGVNLPAGGSLLLVASRP